MSNLNPYLIFNGNAADVIAFYQQALGAEIEYQQDFANAPFPVDESSKNKILHASLVINGAKIMISDTMPDHEIQFGDNISLALNYEDEVKIENQFNALSQGGKVKMPLQKTFWAAKFGMLVDKFGVHWMFNKE